MAPKDVGEEAQERGSSADGTVSSSPSFLLGEMTGKDVGEAAQERGSSADGTAPPSPSSPLAELGRNDAVGEVDRKSTRLNSSHAQ